jgi:hypothetical protein
MTNDVEPDVHDAPTQEARHWGSLSKWGQRQWMKSDCNSMIDSSVDDDGFGGGKSGLLGVGRQNGIIDAEGKKGLTMGLQRDKANGEYLRSIKAQLKNRKPTERIVGETRDSNARAQRPIVAVGCACTTRGIKLQASFQSAEPAIREALSNLPVLKELLPSLLTSIAPDSAKFSFRLYIAVDRDDVFLQYDNVRAVAEAMVREQLASFQSTHQKNFGGHVEEVQFESTFILFDNKWHKPGTPLAPMYNDQHFKRLY